MMLLRLSCLITSLFIGLTLCSCKDVSLDESSIIKDDEHFIDAPPCECTCLPQLMVEREAYHCDNDTILFTYGDTIMNTTSKQDSCLSLAIGLRGCWFNILFDDVENGRNDSRKLLYDHFRALKLNHLTDLRLLPGRDFLVRPNEKVRVLLVEVFNTQDSLNVKSLFTNQREGLGDELLAPILFNPETKDLLDSYSISYFTFPITFFEKDQLETWEDAESR